MKLFKKAKKGFTLVELVVVIAVIAILAAVSVGAYFGVTDSANRSKLEQEARAAYDTIRLVSLADRTGNSSLDIDGLKISQSATGVSTFESDMNKTSGLNYTIDITKPDTITGPTIVLSEAPYEVKNATSSQNVYKNFDYYTNEVSGKYANVNLIGGDIQILSSDFETGEAPEEAETIFTELTIKQGTSLNKRTYIETQNIELDGLVFVAHYKKGGVDLEPVEITDYSKLEYTAGPLTTSTEYVRVSYTDLNTTRYVDITRSFFDVTNLALDGLSYNVDGNIDTEYYVTQSFDISNITFREHFNNGTTSDNAIPHTGLTITPAVFTDEHIGDNNTVTVSYLKDNGETASVEFTNIKVEGIEQTGIEVSPTKIETQYYAGQTLTANDKNLLTVSKVFNYDPTEDNENNAISLDDVTISYQNSEANAFEAGDTKFFVNYGTFSREVEINEVEAVIHTGIEVSMTAATQSTYYVGDSLKFSDYSFNFTNNDGSKPDFTPDDLNNLSAPAFTSAGTQDVIVTYSNGDETFTAVVEDVVVTETKLESISFNEDSEYKNTYIEDEEFDPTGIVIKAHYNDSRQDHDVAYGDEDLSFNATTITKGKKVKAIYKGEECEIPLEISDKIPTKLEIKSGTVVVNYVDGADITTDGLTFEALYNNGKTYDVTDGVTVSPKVASMGLTEIKFSYSEGDETVELIIKNITVTARPVESITLNHTEATLNEGGTLQLTAEVNPSNATYKDVTWKSSDKAFATVSDSGLVEAVAAGEATITAEADGKTATCKIIVNAEESTKEAWVLVTEFSQLEVNDKIIFLDSNNKPIDTIGNGKLTFGTSSITKESNNTIDVSSVGSNIKIFTLKAGSSTGTYQIESSEGLLGYSSSTDIQFGSNVKDFVFAYNNAGNPYFKINDVTRGLLGQTTNNCIKMYATSNANNSGYFAPQIYKLGQTSSEGETVNPNDNQITIGTFNKVTSSSNRMRATEQFIIVAWNGDNPVIAGDVYNYSTNTKTSLYPVDSKNNVSSNDKNSFTSISSLAKLFSLEERNEGFYIKDADGKYLGLDSANENNLINLYDSKESAYTLWSFDFTNNISPLKNISTGIPGSSVYLKANTDDNYRISNFSSTSGSTSSITIYRLGEGTPDPVTPDPEPDEPSGGQDEALTETTISFANTNQRISQNSSSQVWKNGAVTLTNTGSVGNYSNPVRLYANSKVVVDCNNMKEIIFDCNSGSYAATLKNSIGNQAGVTVSVSSDKVTVTFETKVNSFTIGTLTAQVRMDSLTVSHS